MLRENMYCAGAQKVAVGRGVKPSRQKKTPAQVFRQGRKHLPPTVFRGSVPKRERSQTPWAVRQQAEDDLHQVFLGASRSLHVYGHQLRSLSYGNIGEKHGDAAGPGRKEAHIHMGRPYVDDGMERRRKRCFLGFGADKIQIALRSHAPLQVHDGLEPPGIGGLAPESAEIKNNECAWEDMPEKQGGPVEKRNEYHVRHEPRIPDMEEGLQLLLSQAEHLFPFGNECVPALGQAFAIPFEVQARVDNPGRYVFLPWIKRKEHHLVFGIGSQLGRHFAKSSRVTVVTKKDAHVSSNPCRTG